MKSSETPYSVAFPYIFISTSKVSLRPGFSFAIVLTVINKVNDSFIVSQDSQLISKVNREIKLDVMWSYVKRQTAKMKLLPSVLSSLSSRVKIFVFVANSRRNFSIFM